MRGDMRGVLPGDWLFGEEGGERCWRAASAVQPKPPSRPPRERDRPPRRKRPAAPEKHRHGLADDIESPWQNGIRVSLSLSLFFYGSTAGFEARFELGCARFEYEGKGVDEGHRISKERKWKQKKTECHGEARSVLLQSVSENACVEKRAT